MTNRSVENPDTNPSIRYQSGSSWNIRLSAEILRVISNREAYVLYDVYKEESELSLLNHLNLDELRELEEYVPFLLDTEIQELYALSDKKKESLYKAAEIIGNIRVNVEMVYSYELGDSY